ncbi:hemicentin-2-like isoform X4 [Bolinopsis microptera]|uniref:hemicentin-2-like isoform X4 n=1 Tax=Bolinopsis microptera TaxID=2820187 RepID=UPI0030794172
MKNFLLLFVLCLLFNNSKCGPDIFKLTSQPESQTINPGGTVTLSCVATGRTGIIAYSWYQLKSDFNTPPQNTDLISGATGAEYLVDAVDVDESGEGNLFQCKATYGDDIILSNVAMVKYTLEDKLSFTGDSYENIKSETGDDEADPSAFLWRLKCNDNVPDWSTAIKNGEPYDVYWYKGTETDRVEVKYTNMWTYYTSGSTGSNSITLDIGGSKYAEYTDLGQYDLVIFNPQTSDGGTYYCKAVSRGNGNSVTLGSTILDVKEQNNDYDIQSGVIAAGYVVLAVDETGDRKVTPNVGDKVLLMCGGVCRASDKWDIQYKWRKGSNSNSPEVSTSREHIVQTDSAGSVEYRCEIVNGASCGNPDAEKVLFVVQTAEIDPLLQFTFSTSPPEYMWYDTSDNFKSDEPFEINCDGSVSSVTATFLKHVFKKGAQVSSTLPYTFESDIKSARSGVYQCGLYNDPVKMTWYQKTTNVIIASDPTSSITPTSKSVEDGTSATFTCTVGGYPIESVTISDPKSVRTDCPQTSGDITCSSIANTSKYEITVSGFSSAKNGDYTCTVQTRWYKTDSTDMGKVSSDKITLQYVKASTTELTASKTSVNKGDSITLTCVVEGYPEPNRPTLKKKGSSSPIAWTSTCTGTNVKKCLKTFSSPTYSDSGEYLCEGSNTIDGVSKTSDDDVSLTIVGDVEASLAQSPSGTELDKDSPVTYTCKVEGNALPTKLTFKKGNVALKSYDSSDSSSSHADVVKETYSLSYTHTISSLTLEDSAVYMCEGENDNSGIKTDGDTKTLTVVSDVIVTLSASTDTPSFGDTFTITCLTTGGRKPESVELKHDSISIKSYPTNSGFCSSTDSFSLKCTYTTTADYTSGGKYECIGKNIVANNKEVTTTELIDVYVSQTVEVSMTPSSESEVPTGIGFTITCHVEGGGQPHKVTLTTPDSTVLTWLGDSSSGGTLTCIGTFELTCKHTISSPTYTDEGDYRCDGYNRLPGQTTDKTKSATVSLVPINNVDVTLTKSTTEVAFGASFLITCVADGGRIPFYLKLDLRRPDSSVVNDIVLYNKSSQSPASVTVSEELNTLTYIHSVTSSSYDHDGTYKCLSKNRAASNNEQNDEKSENIIVVKDVEIAQINDFDTDFGSSFTFDFTLNGGRPPHLVSLKKGNQVILDISMCTGTNEMTCSSTIGDSDVDFEYDGAYTVTAENRAKTDALKTTTINFRVTVYKEVTATISPSLNSELTYNEDTTITCEVVGGLPPHQVDLILPKQDSMTWTKNGPVTDLTCSGEHELVCKYTFKSDYDSDGVYKCKGYNEVRKVTKVMESSAVTLTTVRKTQVNVPEKPISVLTNGEIKIDCIIVGKPLVDKSSVTWTHSTDLDLSEFVDTVKGNQDNFTLNSTLTMREPLTSYTGTFNCNVADGEKTISGAVEVFIANKEYLESPTVSHTGGEFSEEGSRITVTCRVEGFPAPSASLTYEKQDGTLPTLLNPESFDSKSTTLTEFVFSVTTTCDYAKYDFSCNAQTTISSQPFKSSTLITGPTTTGCENPLPVILGGGIGGGVVFIVIIAVVVFFILRRIKVNKDRSYTPKNGAEFPNPTFVADPTYATVGDSNQVGATGGYSHLNRPAGETDEEGYSCIGQLKPGTANVHPTGEDAYATLDTTSNGMLGLRRQGSNETYAALNRPAPGKAKRGVISKYKPMSNKPKTFGMPPNKPATDDIEMGETSHGGQPDPTYATVNPQTLKSKMKPSNYADVTLPDLPPEVPIYGNSSLIQRPIPSEYADVTVAPPQTPYNMADRQRPILSEYADVTLPGPPEVLYSNMANRQDNTPEEDPVYAQVDLKNRTLPQRRVEEEEDLPPDVPVYGTIGQLTEPDIPDFEDEDPYATVEFVPKSKRKPPRPKPKENASEGVYATITDIKENL